jgi:DNA repair exonuclease SbcCD ATPase subunit
MLEELSARLSKALERKRLKGKLERDLRAVESELRDKSPRLASLSAQLEKERVDVEKLERTSLTTLFYSVLGGREEQLEKERQELLAAQLSYQQTRHQVAYLERERDRLLEQLDRLADAEAEYESLLAEKERLLRQSDQAVAGELIGISEQIAGLNAEMREITEALNAGHGVISGVDRVIEALESATHWGTWDLLGGGIIATAIKHSRVDDARDAIYDVQVKMSQLTRELADVRESGGLQIDITELETFADYFIDGLIFDWIV